ncbi:metallophosphoesterase family protein [Neobacillus sp. FSL H8-0543]|uniref:metallophosphoesterase family protein n=1 Tax=Neobacillus sp. FSL H8-0543 TaxID=2954672 RepID=UPI0031586E2C
MKAAFISDIHGNAVALEAVLLDIEKKGVDKVYVLGDLVFRGPEPKRSLELIRSLHTDVIKGNADEWVIRGVREGEVPENALEMMNRERQWTVEQLDASDLDYLQNLPAELTTNVGGFEIAGFHATPDSLFEVILPDAANETIKTKLMHRTDAQVYIYAHIHLPYIRYIGGKVIINTGSVGLPFDGMPKASYGLIEVENGNLQTSIERVSFDNKKVIDLYKEVSYPNADMMTEIIKDGKI